MTEFADNTLLAYMLLSRHAGIETADRNNMKSQSERGKNKCQAEKSGNTAVFPPHPHLRLILASNHHPALR